MSELPERAEDTGAPVTLCGASWLLGPRQEAGVGGERGCRLLTATHPEQPCLYVFSLQKSYSDKE